MAKKIHPGDLVKNVNHPGLDYRLVLSVGIAQEDSDHVEAGDDYVTLAFPGGPSSPLPVGLYKVVKTREQLAAISPL